MNQQDANYGVLMFAIESAESRFKGIELAEQLDSIFLVFSNGNLSLEEYQKLDIRYALNRVGLTCIEYLRYLTIE